MPQVPVDLSTLKPQDIRRARNDFGFFCEFIGYERTAWQIEAATCPSRQIILISPRQCGKSETLALLAAHTAFRKPGQFILIVSASEEAATRLLGTIREICTHRLLGGSIEDETKTRLVLSNGSKILSVPASEKQIRGWSVDLLLVDEAAFVSEDILVSAAIPTTTARPNARIILASTPWGAAGAFYQLAIQGRTGENPHVRTFQWKLSDAHWIVPEVIQAARAMMSELRFKAEYEGEFISAGDSYFDPRDIAACVADFPLRQDGARMPCSCGLDWGRKQDSHAIALAGLLDDYGVNSDSQVVVPWLESSRRPYGEQIAWIKTLAGLWRMDIRTERNGVGQFASEEMHRRLAGRAFVKDLASTQQSKETAYGRLRVLLAERRIVLPNHPELLKQLTGVTATATQMGGLRIEARTEATHDDIPDALVLAIEGLPQELAKVRKRDFPVDTVWIPTPEGRVVPLPVRTLPAEPDWGEVYAIGETAVDEEQYNPWLDAYAEAAASDPASRMAAAAKTPDQRDAFHTPFPSISSPRNLFR